MFEEQKGSSWNTTANGVNNNREIKNELGFREMQDLVSDVGTIKVNVRV